MTCLRTRLAPLLPFAISAHHGYCKHLSLANFSDSKLLIRVSHRVAMVSVQHKFESYSLLRSLSHSYLTDCIHLLV